MAGFIYAWELALNLNTSSWASGQGEEGSRKPPLRCGKKPPGGVSPRD